MLSNRLRRRLLRHHAPVGTAILASGAALYFTRPYPDIISRLSFASAYPAMALLAATLAIGPLKQMGAGRLPISLDLRRDIGIWAGIAGLFHAIIGQFVHLRGHPLLYYIYQDWRLHALPLRHDLFGAANFTGLAAALILLTLLATSNDLSLRRFGPAGWKRLQRWNYACFGLTVLHCFLYQLGVETQKLPFIAAAALFVVLACAIQYSGFRRQGVPGGSKAQ